MSNSDELTDSEPDLDYIPTKNEVEEAEKEAEYLKTQMEEEMKETKLDEEKKKEIDEIWEKMKSGDYEIEKTIIDKKIETKKIDVVKRRRVSNMNSIISKHSKTNKESTFNKSKKLWELYRKEENIGEELDKESKNSYIEKKTFLDRTKYQEWKKGKEYRLNEINKLIKK